MNMQSAERTIRTVTGLGLLSLLFFLGSDWRWAGLIGLVPLLSGTIGWCPIYAWFMKDTKADATDK